MLRSSLLATVLLFLTKSPAFAKFGVERIEACYGNFGPVRKSLDIYPYDEIVFRFVVTGAGAVDGVLDIGATWKLLDDKGKEIHAQNMPFKGPMALGIDALPYVVAFHFPHTASPGEYTLKVALKDNVTGAEAGFERKVKLKATEFAIVSPRFYYDDKFKVSAPVGGVVGQQLHFQLLVIGFDRASGKVANQMNVEVFDRDKKVVQSRPLQALVESADEKIVKESSTLHFTGWLTMSKPGDFTLRITITDRHSKKTASFEAPLKVTTP